MGSQWEAGPRGVEFSLGGRRPLFILFLAIGLALLVVAVVVLRRDLSSFTTTFVQMSLATGLLFVFVAGRALIAPDDYDPKRVAFDASRGCVRLPSAVEIPFGDIEGLDVRKTVAAERRAGAISTPTAYHHFVVVKTDAAEFEVFQTTDFAEVERVVTAIRSCMERAEPTTVAAPKLPQGLLSMTSGSDVTLRWKNAAAGPLLTFAVAAGAIGFVLSRFALLFAKEGPGAFLVLGFMALLLAFIVFTEVRKFIKHLRTTYELAVTPSSLRYAELPNGRAVEVATGTDLEIRFVHQLGGVPGPIVVRRDHAEFALDIVALSAAEKIELARWLRLKAAAAAYR